MGSLIQFGGGQIRRRFRLPRNRHEAIKPCMLACVLGVAAGIAMLAYGNFGRPSTVEAATTPQTLRIVAAPLDSQSPLPTGIDSPARTDPAADTKLASVETAPDQTSLTISAPAPTSEMDPQIADDAAAAGMTAHVQADRSNLG